MTFLGKHLPTFNRSSLLSLGLASALVFIAAKTYLLWTNGPWDLPVASQVSAPASPSQTDAPAPPPRMAATDIVIGKNLFDPERGATQTKEAEANARAMQRIRGLILVGTIILGEKSYAIVQDNGASAGRPAQGQANQTMRMRPGDAFEGFRLSEIRDRNITFTNGAARVELALDYFRKVKPSAPVAGPAAQPRPQAASATAPGAAPGQPAPRVVPQLPRRVLPPPPSS